MARIVLAIASDGEENAQKRADALGEQFKDHSFGVEPHDRKHQIVLLDGPNPSTPDLGTMKSVAQGYGGDNEQRQAEAEPKQVKPTPMPQRGNESTGSGTTNRPAPTPPPAGAVVPAKTV
jgi:hypothetical protein